MEHETGNMYGVQSLHHAIQGDASSTIKNSAERRLSQLIELLDATSRHSRTSEYSFTATDQVCCLQMVSRGFKWTSDIPQQLTARTKISLERMDWVCVCLFPESVEILLKTEFSSATRKVAFGTHSQSDVP